MSTYDFNMQRNDIIKAALRLIGVLKKDFDPSKSEITNAAQALNMMLKAWQAEDIGVWLIVEAILYTSPGTQSYSLGPSGDNVTLSSVETRISAAASSGDTTISVDSITGMSDGDYVGVELDDGTLQWTRISGAPAAIAITITLTDALADDVAVDNCVYVYASKIQRPMEIIGARLRNKNDDDTPLDFFTRNEYFNMPSKDDTGQIHHVFYDKQMTSGVLYVYPTGTVVTDRLMLSLKYPVADLDVSADNVQYPVEWLEAITYNLAMRLYYEYPNDTNRISSTDMYTLRSDAKASKQVIKDFDTAEGAYQFYPDMSYFKRG